MRLTRREESELLLLVGFTITLESCGTAERCGAVRLMAEGLSSALEGLSVLECSEITNWRGWESARRRQGVFVPGRARGVVFYSGANALLFIWAAKKHRFHGPP